MPIQNGRTTVPHLVLMNESEEILSL